MKQLKVQHYWIIFRIHLHLLDRVLIMMKIQGDSHSKYRQMLDVFGIAPTELNKGYNDY